MGKSLKTSQRTIAAVSIASLALLNVGIMAPAAHAEGDGSTEETTVVADKGFTEPASPALIPDTANLKITKKTPDANTATSEPNGTEAAPTGKPVQGAVFTLYKVDGVDLKTNEGWREANRLAKIWQAEGFDKEGVFDADQPKLGDHNLIKAGDGVATNEQGIVKFDDKDTGLYVVRETIPAEGVTVDKKPYLESAVLKAEPFIVALPLTDPNDRTDWLTTVNVYPKNSVTSIEKEVKDAQTPGSGNTEAPKSEIVYTIKTAIPENTDLKAYDLVDPLDSRLSWVDTDAPVSIVDDSGTKVADLTKGVDYSIAEKAAAAGTPNPATKEDDDTIGKFVTVKFLKPGLEKLKANGGKKVQWDLTANIDGTTGKATIDNEAYLIPDIEGSNNWEEEDEPGTPPPGIPSTKVTSKYGKVTINKVGADKKALNGAEFELWTCDQNAKLGKKVTVDGKSKWVSGGILNEQGEFQAQGTAGEIVIDGLQLNDFKNGVEAATKEAAEAASAEAGAKWKDISFYCLKETKAPADHELLPNVIKFQLLQDDTDFSKSLTIENVPSNGGFDLPLTGGKGIFGLIALGALLVLGSIGYIFFASRRQES